MRELGVKNFAFFSFGGGFGLSFSCFGWKCGSGSA